MAKATLDIFRQFFQSEKAGGFVLIGCTLISLVLANSAWGESYTHFWHYKMNLSFASLRLDYSVEHWINDGLMAVFFLLVGLEIERELYVGELSSFKNAILPVIAATGGMLFPALIHFAFNAGTPMQAGFGIPMATDIAFALGILSLVGSKVPVSVKVFLTALAIIDDLGAITVIALFYTQSFSSAYFFTALGIFFILFIMGKFKIYGLIIYMVGGIIMWYCMLKSGVHATIAGVLLAFAIPFHKDDNKNISYKLQKSLHYPAAFFILPLFALANTAIVFPPKILGSLTTSNSLGIITGLLLGKFTGIFLVSFAAVKLGWARLSIDIQWRHILGISLLGGIGFTMSIFIANLAFREEAMVTASKLSVLFASACAAVIGFLILKSEKKG